MNKGLFALVLVIVLMSNAITFILLYTSRPSPSDPDYNISSSTQEQLKSIETELKELNQAFNSHLAHENSQKGLSSSSKNNELEAIQKNLDEVLTRLKKLENSGITANADIDTFIEQRKERQKLFQAEDGHIFAQELLADKKFAMAANGILTFLEAHPDHPDTQDLMRKARDGFRNSGYLDKALWLQEEIMKKFPEHHAGDLHILSIMKRRMKKYDEALKHIDESVHRANTDDERLNRLFFRAELINEIHGDEAGLEAYREVQKKATQVGMGTIIHSARKRADRIQARLSEK